MLGSIFKPRVLPVTLLVAGLMVGSKFGTVADRLSGKTPAGLFVSEVQAQQPTNVPTPLGETAPPSAQPKAPQPKSGEPKAAMPEGAPAEGAQPKGDAAADAPPDGGGISPTDPAYDPTLFTQNEIDLLQQLAERREEIERRSEELEVRQGLLQAAEQRIDRKIVELRALQTAIDDLVKKHDAQEEAKLRSLVKIYENMKPKDAARIFEQLEITTLLPVAERMSERRLAPIMAEMDPAKAREVTVELKEQRQMPLPGVRTGG